MAADKGVGWTNEGMGHFKKRRLENSQKRYPNLMKSCDHQQRGKLQRERGKIRRKSLERFLYGFSKERSWLKEQTIALQRLLTRSQAPPSDIYFLTQTLRISRGDPGFSHSALNEQDEVYLYYRRDVRQPLLFYLEVPKSAKSGELITVKLGLETEYKECLVVKAYLESPTPMEGNFNFHQTRCLCDDYRVNFLWDFPVYRSVRFAVKVDITDDKNICPDDVAVIPITGSGYHTFRTDTDSIGLILPNVRNLFSLNMKISPMKSANEFTVKLMITNNVDKCMAVKVSTEYNPNIKYLSAHATYTACLCVKNNFFWDIQVSDNSPHSSSKKLLATMETIQKTVTNQHVQLWSPGL
ncbi:hypothetical protein STEG23_035740 [Scotinomys teguina]